MQQCRAELGHPIAGLAVAIETNANARTERRREKKYQTVSESGGQDHASTLTRPPPVASFVSPISAPILLVHPPWEKEQPKVGLHQLPR